MMLTHQSSVDAVACLFAILLLVQPLNWIPGVKVLDTLICHLWNGQFIYWYSIFISGMHRGGGGGSAYRGFCLQGMQGLPPRGRGSAYRGMEFCFQRGVRIYLPGGLHPGDWADPPPPAELEKRTVCILLECFLMVDLQLSVFQYSLELFSI